MRHRLSELFSTRIEANSLCRGLRSVVVAFVAVLIFACPAFPDGPERADDVAMAMIFAFREASQVHLLAHALGTAALNSTPPDEVIKHCDRAIQSYEAVSIPMLGKYLTNVDHDAQTRETFRQIQEMQQLALAEVQAIRAMAKSGNGRAERLAFVEANRAYNEAVQPLAARMVNPAAEVEAGNDSGDTTDDTAIKSPNKRVFSDAAWTEIAEELAKRGFIQEPSDASRFFGTFGLLKLVFVEKEIPDPSTKQLFGLAKVLNVAFHQMTPDKLEATLGSMLRLAKETGTEIASRDVLLHMGEE
jgi:hypothetical protein